MGNLCGGAKKNESKFENKNQTAKAPTGPVSSQEKQKASPQVQQKAPDAPVDDVTASASTQPAASAPAEAAKPATAAAAAPAKKKFNRADFMFKD